MGNYHQKNLKVILSMDQDELAVWLARLPDNEIKYVEWLLDEVETALDDIILMNTGLDEANSVIDEIRKL